MKNSRYLILVFCGLLLFSCTGNKYIVERTPKHNNPVDEISWLKERKKEFEKRECQITLYEKDGKILMPFSVQVHHSFVDGVHIGKLANALQDYLSNFV